ncbi:MAG: photosystem II assembly protein Psb34 [Prochlorotrichaceae cyanobacterium]
MIATHKQATSDTESQRLQNQKDPDLKAKIKTEELIPAEVNARQEREGDNWLNSPSQKGTTVDQEGLTNNYGVEPKEYFAVHPTAYESRQYLIQGLAAAAFVISLVTIAVLAS